ncbi:MAG: SAM-dependent methyltransferase [Candidatus Nezhaarchaeota archaeon]|nr:SAM-dependent methyltransferase [Candidatus Nezhaarchaeota archaeon]
MIKIAIEHLEPHLSRWLWLEYRHAVKLAAGKIEFTNVKREDHLQALSKLAPSHREGVLELYSPDALIILDPQAPVKLSPGDLEGDVVVVVGGILGDHPPRGRTYKLLTSKAKGARARNIGAHQFSIDGAVYVALRVAEGVRVEEVPVKVGITVKAPPFTVHLPYAYPLRRGRPVVSRELIEYLKSGIVEDEERLIRGDVVEVTTTRDG